MQSFTYVILITMCLKSGMIIIFKTPPWFFNQQPSIFCQRSGIKIATKMLKPILNQAYYGEMATSQRWAKLT